MTRREWVNTCARHINAAVKDWPQALSMAGQCAEKQSWENGASGLAWEKPDDVADRAVVEYRRAL